MQNEKTENDNIENMAQDAMTPQVEPKEVLQNDTAILQNETETATDENDPIESDVSSYDVQNDELDALLSEATKTQEDERHESAEISRTSQNNAPMSQEDAAKLAAQGVIMAVGWVGEQTGTPMKITKGQLSMFTMAFTPCVMKYGTSVMNAIKDMTEGAEQDGYMAEIIAGAGVVGLGGTLYWQHRKHKKQNAHVEPESSEKDTKEGVENGD